MHLPIHRFCQFAGSLLFLLGCVLLPPLAWADLKIFDQEVDQPFAGSQSPDSAYMAAVTKAKFEALELAGTYLESLTVVENATLSRDEVTALAGGIMQAQVIDQRNYALPETFGMVLTVRVQVDTSILRQRLERLLADRTLFRKYQEVQEREQELLARIRQLEEQNRTLTAAQRSASPEATEFTQLSAALTASQWIEKALEYWEQGRYTEPIAAISHLDKAIALDNHNPRSYNARALAYLNLGESGPAEDDLRQALRLNPTYPDALNNLGSLYYRRGQYEKAIVLYTQALDQEPDFVEAILNRGMASKRLLQFEDAFEDFRKAVELRPAALAPVENQDKLAEVTEAAAICEKSAIACGLGLCRALTFLRDRGFCQNIPQATTP